jgi:hypothetical protein
VRAWFNREPDRFACVIYFIEEEGSGSKGVLAPYLFGRLGMVESGSVVVSSGARLLGSRVLMIPSRLWALRSK